MATSFYVACHDCRQVSDTDLCTHGFVCGLKEDWLSQDHAGHQVEIVCDVLMDDQSHALYDKVMEYERVNVDE